MDSVVDTVLDPKVITSLGVAAVLGWYLWYDTVIARPKRDEITITRMDALQNQTLNRIESMNDKHTHVVESVCKDFTAALREERVVRREELQLIRAEFKHFRDRESEQG